MREWKNRQGQNCRAENTGMEISTRHCREGVENEGVEFPGGYGCHVCV